MFNKKEDYLLFVEVLHEGIELFALRVSAFCLMPTHYHLLVQTPDANFSRCMRHVNGVYTQRFNRAHSLDGPLFKARYKTIVVAKDDYLLQLVRYIHRNPVKIKNYSTVSSIIARFKRRLQSDRQLSKRVEQVRQVIMSQ